MVQWDRHVMAVSAAAILLIGGVAFAEGDSTAPAGVLVTPESVQWAPAPASLPPGANIAVLEGDPSKPGPFTLRLKFPPNYRVAPHWHPADEHVTVLAGGIHLGLGDTFEQTGGQSLPAGSFRVMPAMVHHFGWTTTEETILQLHGQGPWEIHYLNPADDPRHPQ